MPRTRTQIETAPATVTFEGATFEDFKRAAKRACPEPALDHLPDGDADRLYEQWEIAYGNELGNTARRMVVGMYGASRVGDLRVSIGGESIEAEFTLVFKS